MIESLIRVYLDRIEGLCGPQGVKWVAEGILRPRNLNAREEREAVQAEAQRRMRERRP